MTAALAKVRGFAVAVKGAFGWQASCPTCPWTSPVVIGAYKSDASFHARAHNFEFHGGAK